MDLASPSRVYRGENGPQIIPWWQLWCNQLMSQQPHFLAPDPHVSVKKITKKGRGDEEGVRITPKGNLRFFWYNDNFGMTKMSIKEFIVIRRSNLMAMAAASTTDYNDATSQKSQPYQCSFQFHPLAPLPPWGGEITGPGHGNIKVRTRYVHGENI